MFVEIRLERSLVLLDRTKQRLARRATMGAIAALVLALASLVAAFTGIGGPNHSASQAAAAGSLALAAVAAVWTFALRRRLRRVRTVAETRSEIGGDDADEEARRVTPRDLFSIERLLRTFYEAPSEPSGDERWHRFRSIFAPGALIDPGNADRIGVGLTVDRFVAHARLDGRDVRLRELERTLHVLDDVAVAISAFEVREGDSLGVARGTAFIRLRRSGGTWHIEGVTSRTIEEPVTIRRSLAPSSLHPPDPEPPRPPPRAA
jgi:hypothetical protein